MSMLKNYVNRGSNILLYMNLLVTQDEYSIYHVAVQPNGLLSLNLF